MKSRAWLHVPVTLALRDRAQTVSSQIHEGPVSRTLMFFPGLCITHRAHTHTHVYGTHMY